MLEVLDIVKKILQKWPFWIAIILSLFALNQCNIKMLEVTKENERVEELSDPAAISQNTIAILEKRFSKQNSTSLQSFSAELRGYTINKNSSEGSKRQPMTWEYNFQNECGGEIISNRSMFSTYNDNLFKTTVTNTMKTDPLNYSNWISELKTQTTKIKTYKDQTSESGFERENILFQKIGEKTFYTSNLNAGQKIEISEDGLNPIQISRRVLSTIKNGSSSDSYKEVIHGVGENIYVRDVRLKIEMDKSNDYIFPVWTIQKTIEGQENYSISTNSVITSTLVPLHFRMNSKDLLINLTLVNVSFQSKKVCNI